MPLNPCAANLSQDLESDQRMNNTERLPIIGNEALCTRTKDVFNPENTFLRSACQCNHLAPMYRTL